MLQIWQCLLVVSISFPLLSSWSQCFIWENKFIKEIPLILFYISIVYGIEFISQLKRRKEVTISVVFHIIFLYKLCKLLATSNWSVKHCMGAGAGQGKGRWWHFPITISFVSWSSTYINSSYKDHCSRTKFLHILERGISIALCTTFHANFSPSNH